MLSVSLIQKVSLFQGWTIYLRPDDGWRVTHRNSRVIDPQENRDENPWEWRNNEMDLEQCKTKCWEFENTCTGIEFECDDGTCDCIMLRGTSRTVNNAPGWYATASAPRGALLLDSLW